MRCGRAHTQHKVLGALRHAPIPVLSRHRLILLLLSCPRLPALGLRTLFSPDHSALGKGWMEAGIMSSSSTLLQSVPGVWDLTKPTKTQGTLRNESNAKKYVEREMKKMKFTDMSSRRSRARLSAPRALPPQQDATAPRCTGAISACHFPKFMHVVFLEGPRDVTRVPTLTLQQAGHAYTRAHSSSAACRRFSTEHLQQGKDRAAQTRPAFNHGHSGAGCAAKEGSPRSRPHSPRGGSTDSTGSSPSSGSSPAMAPVTAGARPALRTPGGAHGPTSAADKPPPPRSRIAPNLQLAEDGWMAPVGGHAGS